MTAPETPTISTVREALDVPDPRERVQVVLERAMNYRQCVRALHDSLDVPDEVIAHVAGVVPGSVRRWRSTDPNVGEPRLAQAQAIERVRRIALILVASKTFYDLRGVGVWLQAGVRSLKWRAPYEVLVEEPNGYELVMAEAERFIRPGAGVASASLEKASDQNTVAGFGPPRPELAKR